VVLGPEGPPLYTFDDKHAKAKRRLELICPAPVSKALGAEARAIALRAFTALNCRDWARVEMRLDAHDDLQLLEVNTIPGLGSIASFPAAARVAGMEGLPAIVQRLVEVAVERYRAGWPK
jgi:D-alanine-D-alanine ligase